MFKYLKSLFGVFMTAFICMSFVYTHKAHAEGKVRVGLVVSQLSEKYAFIEREGGYHNGTYIQPKLMGSSIKNKRIKAQLLLENLGYEVEHVNDAQLSDPKQLAKFDSLFFTNTVMMSKAQRQAVKEYIKNGGGAIFAFAMARNDSARFPYKDTDLDLTPIIYETKTWIWEWDNLSEVFQSAFINDVAIGNFTIKTVGSHPIVSNALKRLGKTSILLENRRLGKYQPTWIEVIQPYQNNSYAAPILQYETIGYSSVPEHTPPKTGAAYAIEYGKGKAVWFGFQLLDYMAVDERLSNEWDEKNPDGWPETKGKAWDYLQGGEDLKVLLDESVKWTAQPLMKFHPIDRKVTMELTDVRAYPRASDYVVYGTMKAKNNGNVISRGTMKVELTDPFGKVKASYEKYVVGLVPKGESYPEKFALTLPKNIPVGNYQLTAYYRAGRNNHDGVKIAGHTKIISIQDNKKSASILNMPSFKDVSSNYWAKEDIDNLVSLGVITGYKDGTFKPEAPVSRLQAAVMIVRSLGLSTKNRPNPQLGDVKPGQYGYDVIATVVDEGIFSGSNGRFHPAAPLTREQMAKILVNAYRLTGEDEVRFRDISSSQWSRPYIGTLLANQVTQANEFFRPNERTTRAQFAAFVNRSLRAVDRGVEKLKYVKRNQSGIDSGFFLFNMFRKAVRKSKG